MTWDWSAVEAIATCVLALGIGAVFWQIIVTRESTRKNTGAQLAVDLLHLFRNEDTKNTLRFIYNLKDMNHLSEAEKHRIENVLDRFTLLGDLVNRGIIAEDMAIKIGPSALRCWYKLVNYIRIEREERGYMFEDYEGFTERVLKVYRDEGIKVLFRKEDETKNINLVTELGNKEICPRSFKQIKKDNKKKRKEVTR